MIALPVKASTTTPLFPWSSSCPSIPPAAKLSHCPAKESYLLGVWLLSLRESTRSFLSSSSHCCLISSVICLNWILLPLELPFCFILTHMKPEACGGLREGRRIAPVEVKWTEWVKKHQANWSMKLANDLWLWWIEIITCTEWSQCCGTHLKLSWPIWYRDCCWCMRALFNLNCTEKIQISLTSYKFVISTIRKHAQVDF